MDFLFQDESDDKKYFTVVPNYILNHSTAIDQALYMQIKRAAGERGECFYSQATMVERLGVSRNTVKKSIKYLIDHKWITLKGKKKIPSKSGAKFVNCYKINDIWKLNIESFEKKADGQNMIVSSEKEVADGQNMHGADGQNVTTKKNSAEKKNQNTPVLRTGRPVDELIYLFKEVNPNYETLFPRPPQRKAIERMLGKFGREKLENAIKILSETNGQPYAPTITTPIQLEDNLGKLAAYVRKEKAKVGMEITFVK